MAERAVVGAGRQLPWNLPMGRGSPQLTLQLLQTVRGAGFGINTSLRYNSQSVYIYIIYIIMYIYTYMYRIVCIYIKQCVNIYQCVYM